MAITNLQLEIIVNAIMAPIEIEVKKMYAKKLASPEFKETVKRFKNSSFIRMLIYIHKQEAKMEKSSNEIKTLFYKEVKPALDFHLIADYNWSPSSYSNRARNIPDLIHSLAKKQHGLDIGLVLTNLRNEVRQNIVLSDMKNHALIIKTITESIKSKLNDKIWKN